MSVWICEGGFGVYVGGYGVVRASSKEEAARLMVNAIRLHAEQEYVEDYNQDSKHRLLETTEAEVMETLVRVPDGNHARVIWDGNP